MFGRGYDHDRSIGSKIETGYKIVATAMTGQLLHP